MSRRIRSALLVFALATGAITAGAVRPQGMAEAAACRVAHTMRYSTRGDGVLCLERTLLSLGYMSSYIDTYFGTVTVSAVKRFQTTRRLPPSGVVDPTTARALGIWSPRPVSVDRPRVSRIIGRSVNGAAIWAHRYGTPGGKVVVAIGQIHGNEPGGPMISAYLRVRGAPAGIDMWVLDTVNPDGWRAQRRTNARLVDLNRNFNSGTWVRAGAGTSQWGGPSAASEPETRAVQTFLNSIRPRMMVVWHQVGGHVDDNRSVAKYSLLRRYASLTGFPVRGTASCNRCGGTLTSYANRRFSESTAFTVEMPATFSYSTAQRHGEAFLAIARLS